VSEPRPEREDAEHLAKMKLGAWAGSARLGRDKLPRSFCRWHDQGAAALAEPGLGPDYSCSWGGGGGEGEPRADYAGA